VDSKTRDDLTRGARTLHVGGKGRHGSHLVIYRVLKQQKIVDVIRILHDGMDPTRHIPRNK
jgi:toxin ParE1/3/4